MKHLLLMLAFVGGSAAHAEEVLVVEGEYQNKNVYISNSLADDGVGFCAYEVRVNGDVTSDAVNSSAFEVDLSMFNLNPGEKVTITIKHKPGCAPKVLNPGDLQPLPEFKVEEININDEGMLQWKASNESGTLPYLIEQFKWNKWVKVGEVNSTGTQGVHDYAFKVTLTNGENKFRVVQKNMNGKTKVSPVAKTMSNRSPIELEYKNREKKILFSGETFFEVYDAFGIIRKRGFGTEVDLSNMEKGDYYINFDNRNEKIRFKG